MKSIWDEYFTNQYTPLRCQMHQALEAHFVPKGKCLDLGGGTQTYLSYVGLDKSDTLLFDLEDSADVQGSLEEPLPFEDASFETILMLNVLSLLYDYQGAVNETCRVLAKGGTAYVWSPFLTNITYHPADYFRFSDMALDKIFKAAGYSKVEIHPYGGIGNVIGTYIAQLFQKIPKIPGMVRYPFHGLNYLISKAVGPWNFQKWPLGYLVVATK